MALPPLVGPATASGHSNYVCVRTLTMWPKKNGGSRGTATACYSAFPLCQRQLLGRSLAVCPGTVLHTGVACAHVANYSGR